VLVVGLAARLYGDTTPEKPHAREDSMNTHPTIVHAAADLRRHALLSEAADDWRTTPSSGPKKSTGPGKVCRRMVVQIAAVVSRVIDDFEPGPGPRSPETARLGSRMRS
jgi:hypothetical protein